MISDMKPHKNKLCILLVICVFLLINGCAGPKVAFDLLTPPTQNADPLLNNAVIIETEVNPRINNYEKMDETLKESLETALKNANIFGTDTLKPYKIKANILVASQAAASFGNFEGKLEVHYSLLDSNDDQILDEKIYTEAGSDEWSLVGAKRHRRARAVNIAKNVLQFVEILQKKLK